MQGGVANGGRLCYMGLWTVLACVGKQNRTRSRLYNPSQDVRSAPWSSSSWAAALSSPVFVTKKTGQLVKGPDLPLMSMSPCLFSERSSRDCSEPGFNEPLPSTLSAVSAGWALKKSGTFWNQLSYSALSCQALTGLDFLLFYSTEHLATECKSLNLSVTLAPSRIAQIQRTHVHHMTPYDRLPTSVIPFASVQMSEIFSQAFPVPWCCFFVASCISLQLLIYVYTQTTRTYTYIHTLITYIH